MALPNVVTRILRSTAPTLLTALALPPPFNVIASAVVTTVLQKYLPADQVPTQPETPAGAPPAMTPAQITQTIEKNATDPGFVEQLRKAELELKNYEIQAGIRFAELEVEDRKINREFQSASGLSARIFGWGMGLVIFALSCMVGVVGGSLFLAGLCRFREDCRRRLSGG